MPQQTIETSSKHTFQHSNENPDKHSLQHSPKHSPEHSLNHPNIPQLQQKHQQMLAQTSKQSQQIVSTLEHSTKHTDQQNIQQPSLQHHLSVPQNSNVLLTETNLNEKPEENVFTVTKESILKKRKSYQNKNIKKLELPFRIKTLSK
ncbi:unnamed protein product [Meloidogyne enterolobii]|uniref:Uncharacterized protein n=1 Tax=Meloidogyne enterolobii TaxID=390850 RepID=A0ACB1A5I4_MELEN